MGLPADSTNVSGDIQVTEALWDYQLIPPMRLSFLDHYCINQPMRVEISRSQKHYGITG